MMKTISAGFLAVLLLLAACTQKQQTQANERAEQAKRDLEKAAHKVKNDAERLGNDVKRKSQELSDKTRASTDTVKPDTEGAEAKLDRAADKAKHAAHGAKAGADRIALKTRIKTALANDVGLKTLSSLSVDLDGSTATLTGTVPTDADKERAERVTSSVSGVSRVVNRLTVQ